MQKPWMAAMVAVVVLFGGLAHAGQVVSIDENRTFRLSEERVLLEIPNVPRGLTAEQVQALAEGKIPPVTVESDANTISFAFPWVWSEVTHSKSVISYDAKGWRVSPPSVSASSKSVDWVGTILLVWLIPLVVGIAGLVLTQLVGMRLRWLPLWYLGCGVIVFPSGELPPSRAVYFQFFLAVMVNSFIWTWGVQVLKEAGRDWRRAFLPKPKLRKRGETATITARSGDEIVVDISDEAIAAFWSETGIEPMRHGEPFNGKCGRGVIMGVTDYQSGVPRLWTILDHDNGKASFFCPFEPKDIRPI